MIKQTLMGLFVTVLAAATFLILSTLYYMITIWVIKTGASWAGYGALEGSMVVLTAGIVTAASMIGSALKR
jgi:hypothetical protein